MEQWSYGSSSKTEREIAVVRAIYDAFERRDLEGAVALMAPDVELAVHATSSMAGRDGPYRGHDGIREYMADAERVWTELVLHADDIRAATGSVIVFGHVRGRIGAEIVQREVMWTWRLRDGLAVSIRVSDIGQRA